MANFPPPQMMYPNAYQSMYTSQTNSAPVPNNNNYSYPTNTNYLNQNNDVDQLTNKMNSMVVNQGWNQSWNNLSVNLLTEKDIRTRAIQDERNKELAKMQQQKVDLSCDKNIMRSTMKKLPENASLLQKCRLPLGILLHPFKAAPVCFVLVLSFILKNFLFCRTFPLFKIHRLFVVVHVERISILMFG